MKLTELRRHRTEPHKMKKYTGLIFWAYAVEVLLTLLIYGLLLLYMGNAKAVNLIHEHWGVVLTVAGIIFGVSVAILIWYYQVIDSEFGKFLQWRKVDIQMRRVFQFQTILPFVTICVTVSVAVVQLAVLAHILLFLLLYTCLNCVTVILNMGQISHLKQHFRLQYDLLKSEGKTE
jgi:hypothetical protein